MNVQQLLSLVQMALNVTLTAIPQTAPFAPLAVALETSIAPLIASLLSGAPKTQDVLAGYGAMIGIIQTLKAQTGLAPEVLAKLDEYLTAAQNGTVEALAAGVKGYDPNQLTPVAPIA